MSPTVLSLTLGRKAGPMQVGGSLDEISTIKVLTSDSTDKSELNPNGKILKDRMTQQLPYITQEAGKEVGKSTKVAQVSQ